MDANSPFDIVRFFSKEIQNGRSLADIMRHTKSEMAELDDELALVEAGAEEGKDGIVGEAIDVIACMMDLIFVHAPNTTDAQLTLLLLQKCEKWARRYKDSVDGDRSID